MTTTYNITYNAQYDSHEVTFESKPATAVLDALKALKMRWNPKKACWYGFAKEHEIINAILENGEGETITGEKTEGATVYTDGYLGGGAVYGSKSNLHLYGADLSKAIREDIKRAGIKGVTVRCKSYSGGQSIGVTVALRPDEFVSLAEYVGKYEITPENTWIYTGNGEPIFVDYYFGQLSAQEQEETRVAAAEYDYERMTTRENRVNEFYIDEETHFTPETLAKIKTIQAIICAYRYDESNSQVDYFHTNFYYDIYTKPVVVKPTTPDDEPTKPAKEEPKEEPATEETAPVQPAEQAQESENVVESVVESAEAPAETEDEPETVPEYPKYYMESFFTGWKRVTKEQYEKWREHVRNGATAQTKEGIENILARRTRVIRSAEEDTPENNPLYVAYNIPTQPEPTPAETLAESAGEIPEENIEQTAITRYEDLTGKKFGALTVIGLKGVINSRRIWRCVCDCGNLREIREDSLKKYTRSCGDPRHRNPNTIKIIHGQSKTRLYNIWGGMKDRCFNPRASGYQYYGERGITVCDEWAKDFQSFYEWATQNGYSDDLSIDRIDTNGNYEPSNCRWATAKEQRLNQRQKEITYNGETHTLLEWSEITQIKYATLIWRYHQNWSVDKILSPDNFAENTKFKPKSNKNKHGSGS